MCVNVRISQCTSASDPIIQTCRPRHAPFDLQLKNCVVVFQPVIGDAQRHPTGNIAREGVCLQRLRDIHDPQHTARLYGTFQRIRHQHLHWSISGRIENHLGALIGECREEREDLRTCLWVERHRFAATHHSTALTAFDGKDDVGSSVTGVVTPDIDPAWGSVSRAEHARLPPERIALERTEAPAQRAAIDCVQFRSRRHTIVEAHPFP
jgi:hypothetical protein